MDVILSLRAWCGIRTEKALREIFIELLNRRLKKMYAEERIKAEIRQEALEGKL
jgi:putative transposase